MIYLGCDLRKRITGVSLILEDGRVLGTRKIYNSMTDIKLSEVGKNHRGQRDMCSLWLIAFLRFY